MLYADRIISQCELKNRKRRSRDVELSCTFIVRLQFAVCDQLKPIKQLIDSGTGDGLDGVLTVEIRGEDGVK